VHHHCIKENISFYKHASGYYSQNRLPSSLPPVVVHMSTSRLILSRITAIGTVRLSNSLTFLSFLRRQATIMKRVEAPCRRRGGCEFVRHSHHGSKLVSAPTGQLHFAAEKAMKHTSLATGQLTSRWSTVSPAWS
jgi:hypothetical protein